MKPRSSLRHRHGADRRDCPTCLCHEIEFLSEQFQKKQAGIEPLENVNRLLADRVAGESEEVPRGGG